LFSFAEASDAGMWLHRRFRRLIHRKAARGFGGYEAHRATSRGANTGGGSNGGGSGFGGGGNSGGTGRSSGGGGGVEGPTSNGFLSGGGGGGSGSKQRNSGNNNGGGVENEDDMDLDQFHCPDSPTQSWLAENADLSPLQVLDNISLKSGTEDLFLFLSISFTF
jgi:hypothetical protein